MTDMVERVARAIYAAECWDTATPGFYQHAARAAIAAMREPTDEMVDAAWEPSVPPGNVAIWQAMIDAAMGDKT
jgi:hypothetical protein